MAEPTDNPDAPLIEAMSHAFVDELAAIPPDQGDWPSPAWKDVEASEQAVIRLCMTAALAAFRTAAAWRPIETAP